MAEVVPLASFDADTLAEYRRREDRAEGTGDHFYAQIQEKFGQLADFPHSGSAIAGTRVRRLLACKRRFAIVHVVEGQRVMLHALLDLHADPEYNARRIREIILNLSRP
jgi:plasmid stabilization system protein ParE